jgi:hypothetical protein
MWRALSDKRLGLSFSVVARHRQRSPWVWVPQTHEHILLSPFLRPPSPTSRASLWSICRWTVKAHLYAKPEPILSKQLKFQVILWPTVSPPVRVGVGLPSGAYDQILSTVGHLRPSCCVAPSLTRGQVCNLLEQFTVTLGSKSLRIQTFYCLVWDSPTRRARSPYLYSQGTAWARYNPGHWIPFLSPLTNRLQTISVTTAQSQIQSQSYEYIMIDGQSASLSWCQAPIWDPRPNFPPLFLTIFKQLQVSGVLESFNVHRRKELFQ